MEWKEILDKFNKSCNGHINYGMGKDVDALLEAIKAMLIKLTSEESNKPDQELERLYELSKPKEPVKDGFLFKRQNNKTGKVTYFFEDHCGDDCFIEYNEFFDSDGGVSIGVCNQSGVILSQDMVRALLPLLQEFVDKGEIN